MSGPTAKPADGDCPVCNGKGSFRVSDTKNVMGKGGIVYQVKLGTTSRFTCANCDGTGRIEEEETDHD